MQVSEILEQIRANIQVKLARQGMPTDRETLEEVCVAIACLVRDPDSLRLQMIPISAEDYAVVEDCLALADRDFAEEITALQTLVSVLQDSMRDEMQSWVEAGRVRATEAPEIVRELLLTQFIDPDGETSAESS